jgi:hypothetical protein
MKVNFTLTRLSRTDALVYLTQPFHKSDVNKTKFSSFSSKTMSSDKDRQYALQMSQLSIQTNELLVSQNNVRQEIQNRLLRVREDLLIALLIPTLYSAYQTAASKWYSNRLLWLWHQDRGSQQFKVGERTQDRRTERMGILCQSQHIRRRLNETFGQILSLQTQWNKLPQRSSNVRT